MRLVRATVRDVRSIWGAPLQLDLGPGVTALVGPNQAGKSNVVRAIVAALDPAVVFALERERPRGRPSAIPEVTLTFGPGPAPHPTLTVTWLGGARSELAAHTDEPLPSGPGSVVLAEAGDTLSDIVTRLAPRLGLAHAGRDERATSDPSASDPSASDPSASDRAAAVAAVEEALHAAISRLIPEIGRLSVAVDGPRVTVTVRDDLDFVVRHDAGFRGAAVIGLTELLLERGERVAAVAIEEPEAFLHPAAQETLRDALEDLARTVDTAVLITSESPFVIPRSPEARIVAVARDGGGGTGIVGTARGDEPQAPLLGGLFRDPGFAAVLDRTTRLGEGVRGVVIFEGGTDEAYLRLAADALGRSHELERLAIHPAGGAMAAALQAIVLRAETGTPLLVVLDNDEAGRRAKETLVSRFGFDNREQVTTYAELIPGHPVGAEAEDVFDWRFVARFVAERGASSTRGSWLLRGDERHFDLTSSAKSAFVGWARTHAGPDDLARWSALLDVLAERLPG